VGLLIVIAVIALIVGWHGGHGHANYRHARSAGRGRKPSLYLGARGAWVSVPGPFGTRIGHRVP
jgi:hypothetical protein